jgi:hypothetical protein
MWLRCRYMSNFFKKKKEFYENKTVDFNVVRACDTRSR